MLPLDGSGQGAHGPARGRGGGGHYTPSALLPQYFRRLLHYPQMDLEFTFSQMVYLCTSPSKVYKSTSLRKRKCL